MSELTKDKARGDAAARLLQNETLSQAFADLKDDYRRAWENSPYEAKEARDDAFYELRALKRLEQKLDKYIKDGKLANHKLSLLEKAAQKFKR